MAHSITVENEIPQLTEQIGMDDTIEQVASKVLTTNVNAINETYDLLKADDIEKAIDYMVQAERIHFFGVGTSLIKAASPFFSVDAETAVTLL
ncbi:hypothetical protein N2384_08290 [Bacillus paralicheniformis]|nr:hypothetical protein [Bacillus paralicheniformis]UWS62897.1 hypothetical protein N2384_08290 [Bacillus paralicheniformis]